MYCIKCGAKIKENALYCVKCGAKAITYNSLNKYAPQKALEPNVAQHHAEERNKETSKKKIRKSTIVFLICIICVFMFGFFIYGYLGSGFFGRSKPFINENVLQSFIVYGFLGGLLLIKIPTVIFLIVTFRRKRVRR